MPQIVNKTYFQKSNDLYIPLSVTAPVSNASAQSPSNVSYLDNLCVKVEKSILLNALGLTAYNELQTALADINNPLFAKWKLLVEGEGYDGKVWEGLNNDYSLIAYRIYEEFVTDTNDRLSAIGTTQVNPQSASLVTPMHKIANANSNFLTKYQDGYLIHPIVYNDGEFIDWFGSQEAIEVSLYRYLNDKKANFTSIDLTKFRVYESKNSFGI
jgi:hypothetical protein